MQLWIEQHLSPEKIYRHGIGAILVCALFLCSKAHSFVIYNETNASVIVMLEDSNLIAGEFSHTIAANKSWACNWKTAGCNPKGGEKTLLYPNIETSRSNGQFTCVLGMEAGGWMRIREHARDSLIHDAMEREGRNYRPQYSCESFNVDNTPREKSNTLDLRYFDTGSEDRNVHFLAAGDDQYFYNVYTLADVLAGDATLNQVGQLKPNSQKTKASSDGINMAMTNALKNDNTLRGIIYAGDITQTARWRELEWHLTSLKSKGRLRNGLGYLRGANNGNGGTVVKRHRDLARFVYGGLGNHDMERPNLVPTACVTLTLETDKAKTKVNPNCQDPGMLLEHIRDQHHATALTGWGTGRTPTAPDGWLSSRPNPVNPHHSWDWDDVFFVQLNLFPGDEKPKAKALDPYKSLAFLKVQLDKWIGNSGRPVVLIHHYGMHGSAGSYWDADQKLKYWNAIADYNVIAILHGHLHTPTLYGNRRNGWKYQWKRPEGSEKGPDSFDTYNVAAAKEGTKLPGIGDRGAYVDITIDNDTMKLTVRNELGHEPDDRNSRACKTLPGGAGPQIYNVPRDTTVECDGVPQPFPGVFAIDSCGVRSTPKFTEERIDGTCGQSYILKRTWVATDPSGSKTTEMQLVSVEDTTPPTLQTDAENRVCLAPPNGGYVHFGEIRGMVGVTDNCDPNPGVASVTCASNQCDNAPCEEHPALKGDGNTINDCIYNRAADQLSARSERAMRSTQREYSVSYTAIDECGNESDPVVGFSLDVPSTRKTKRLCWSPDVPAAKKDKQN